MNVVETRSLSRIWVFVMVFSSMGIHLKGQVAEDALFFSRQGPYGTTRAMSTMNSINALGADINVVNSNPAGLANFRKSEFVFSSSVEAFQSDGSIDQIGDVSSERSAKYQIDNLGVIIEGKPRNSSEWKQTNFAISYQRLQSHQVKYGLDARTAGSLSQRFLETAFGKTYDEMNPFFERLALDGFVLIEGQDVPENYTIDFREGDSVDKFDLYELSGSLMNFSASFAANYRDKLLLGITLSFPSFNRSFERTYIEEDKGNQVPVFDELSFFEDGRIEGNGINGKLGIVYNVDRALRIGISTETPTRYRVTEPSYVADLEYSYTLETSNFMRAESPELFYEYNIITPWRHSLSVGSVISRKGFIAARVDYKDYTQLRFDFGDDRDDRAFEELENNRIDSLFESSLTFSLGGELALENFRIRAGYGFEQSPYSSDQSDIQRLSGGLGWRGENVYIDLGYLNEAYTQDYLPYQSDFFPETRVEQKILRHRVSLTLGFKF